MAVSIDARVGQREIDAANREGADIEGVTSAQGTPVSPVEQQVTFGGYPNQMGPSLLSNQGLLNQEGNVIDIISNLHPDFVANASPEELDYAISVVKGNVDYDVTETLTPELGAMEMQIRQMTAQNKALDQQIKEMEAWNKKTKKEIKSASVSPWMAEARLGPPIGSGGNVGAYIEQQQMGMGPPLGWSAGPYGTMATEEFDSPTALAGTSIQEDLGTGFAPDFFSNEANWGAGSYQPTVNIEEQAPLARVDVTGQRTTDPLNTLEQWKDWVENPVNTGMQGLSGSYNIGTQAPWVEDTTTTTKKSNYGAWTGKLNKLKPEENNKNFNTFQKAWMNDLKNDPEFVEHFKMVEKLGGHLKAAFTPSYMKDYQRIQGKINDLKRDDAYLTAYGETIGVNPAIQGVSNLASMGVGMFGKWGTNMVRSRGLGSAETYAESKARVENQEYEGQGDAAEVSASARARSNTTGGFWGLMAFAKKNPKIFGTLSGDELWSLVSDPDGFWEFYEAALVGE